MISIIINFKFFIINNDLKYKINFLNSHILLDLVIFQD
jgi:hypothetical protein